MRSKLLFAWQFLMIVGILTTSSVFAGFNIEGKSDKTTPNPIELTNSTEVTTLVPLGTGVDPTCNGACDGSISLVVTGGTTPYSYSWSFGSNVQSPVGLCAGTYTVTITDSGGSTSSTLPWSYFNTGSNHTVLVQTAPMVNGVAIVAGDYIGAFYDAGGTLACGGYVAYVPGFNAVTVWGSESGMDNGFQALEAFTWKVWKAVDGGEVNMTAVYAAGPTTYTTQGTTIIGSMAGTYTPGGGGSAETATWSITLADPNPLTLTASLSDYSGYGVSVFGGSDGYIDLSVSGGTTAYSYAWSNGSSTEDLSGLSAGTYTVTVTDALGCTGSDVYTLTQPAAAASLAASGISVDASCAGVCDGSIDLSVSGGASPYTYLWSNGFTAQDPSGLCAGTYTVTVTDSGGGGGGAFSWSYTNTGTNHSILVQTPPVVNGIQIATGDYIGAFYDASGTLACGGYEMWTGANAVTVWGSESGMDNGFQAGESITWKVWKASDGAVVDMTATYAAGPTTFTANGITVMSALSGSYTPGSGGTAETATASFTIVEPAGMTLSAILSDYSGYGVSAYGASDGSVNLSVSGGTPPYTYLWTTGSTLEDLSGVSAGTFDVTVTDGSGCTATGSYTLTQPALTSLTTGGTTVNASCNGICDGSIDFSVSGGVTPYVYAWSNGASTEDLTALCAGTYTVTVTDSGGGGSSSTTMPWSFLNTGSNHTILVQNAPIVNSLPIATGDYVGAFYDAGGTLACGGYMIWPGNPFAITIWGAESGMDNGFQAGETIEWKVWRAADGSIADMTAVFSTGPTIYTTNGISQLLSLVGSYSPGSASSATASFTITQPNALALSVILSDYSGYGVSANGASDGSIDLSVSGGMPAYIYLWSNGSTLQDLTGVAAGTYDVTVTDNNGCTGTGSYTLTQPAAQNLTAAGSSVNASCNGVCDGSIDLTVTGGFTPYSFAWSNGATTEDIGSLCADTYTVTVTDSGGGGGSSTTMPWTFFNTGSNHTILVQSAPMINSLPIATGDYIGAFFDAGGTLTCGGYMMWPGTPYAITIWGAESGMDNGFQAGESITWKVWRASDGGIANATAVFSTGPTTYTTNGISQLLSLIGSYSPGSASTTTASFTITEPNALVLAATLSDYSGYGVSANGASDGSIDLSVSGGMTPYSYIWSNGATVQDLLTVIAGTYGVTVSDSNGCTATGSYILSEPPAQSLTASGSSVDASCNGLCDGSIDLTVVGGISPYTFAWSNAAITEDLSGLCAGTYTVTVTDSGGSASSPTMPWSFLNTGTNHTILVQSLPTINGVQITAGDYIGLFYDAGGTLACGGYEMWTGANAVTAWGAESGMDNGFQSGESFTWKVWRASDGAIVDMNPSYASGPTTFTANGITVMSTLSGTYSSGGGTPSTATATFTITEPAAIVLSAVLSDYSGYGVSVNGASDGFINLTVSGGLAPYTFLWSNNAFTQNMALLAAGIYGVTVTDANGCTASGSYTITEPPIPPLTTSAVSGTDATCFDDCDGAIDLAVAGGVTPYSYMWSNGAMTQDISGLCAGNYTVTVTDSGINSTGATLPWTFSNTGSNHTLLIQTLPQVNGSPIANGDYIGAFYDSAGTSACAGYLLWTGSANAITVWGAESGMDNGFQPGEAFNWKVWKSVDGGVATMTATYAMGPTSYTTNGLTVVSTLTGFYVPLGSGTSVTASFTVGQPAAIVIGSTVANVSCNGAADGSIALNVSGGTAPYTYLWNNSAVTSSISGLMPGIYSVTVTDNAGCTASDMFTITEPAPITLVLLSQQDVSCNGFQDGALSVSASGGTGSLSYLWSNGATSPSISGLAAAIYIVTVTDAVGCTVSMAYTIVQPALLSGTIATTDVSCSGGNDGSATVTVSGGTAPYVYIWSNGSNGTTASALAAGTYTVTVTDSNQCQWIGTAQINEPAVIQIVTAVVNVSCFGLSNGQITVTVSGGTPSYTYLWSGGETTASLSNVAAGTYTLTVTDMNMCQQSVSVTVTQPSEIQIGNVTVDVSCYGGSDGYIDLLVSGGAGQYTYSWSHGPTTMNVQGLSAGQYSVIVTDMNGCQMQANFTVSEPAPLVLTTSVIDVSCFGNSDGQADVQVSGGTPGYTYVWSNTATAAMINNLAAGSYTVTVTDMNGCTALASVLITEPALLAVFSSHTNVLCNGDVTGTADLTVSGGTLPYTYAWSNGATMPSLSGLMAGTYTVTVSDDNGCTSTASVVITEPGVLNAVATATDVTCAGYQDGTVNLAVAGGVSAYTYLWNTGATTPNLTNVSSDVYSVTVTDANGCTTFASAFVGSPILLEVQTSWNDVICFGDNNGGISLFVNYGTSPYTYNWSNGGNTATVSNLAPGTYAYTVVDANGCGDTGSQVIMEGAQINIASTVSNSSCLVCVDGAISLSVSGGTPAYSYLWNTGETSASRSGLLPGVYDVTVTDSNACTGTASITVDSDYNGPTPNWSFINTGSNHTILVTTAATPSIDGVSLSFGDFIGVFYDSLGTLVCGGYVMWTETNTAVSAWGEDAGNDGFASGESFNWIIWRASDQQSFSANATYLTTMPNQGDFSSNGVSGLQSLAAVTTQTQTVYLPTDWSIFSTYLIPDEPNIDSVLSVVSSDIQIAKNYQGQAYWPLYGINLIGNMVIGEGYQIKMSAAHNVDIVGMAVVPETITLSIPGGWSLLGYLRQSSGAIATMLSPLTNLEIAKDENGAIYWPIYSVNLIGNMLTGEGYQLKLSGSQTLTYPPNTALISKAELTPIQPVFFTSETSSDRNQTLGIPYAAWNGELEAGDEIGIFNTQDELVGSTVFRGGFTALTLWGDDEISDELSGLVPGEAFIIKTWNHSNGETSEFFVEAWKQGNGFYKDNQISIVASLQSMDANVFSLGQNQPNPFNNSTQISFYLPVNDKVQLTIYNELGELVKRVEMGELTNGEHQIEIQTDHFESGVYYYQLGNSTQSLTRKMFKLNR